MTSAKPKPTPPQRTPTKSARPVAAKAKPAVVEAPAGRKPGSTAKQGPRAQAAASAKSKAASATPKPGLPQALPVKAAPVKAAPVKAVKAAPIKASKPAPVKAASAKPTASKAIAASAAPSKAIASKPAKAAQKSATQKVVLDSPAKIRPIEQAVGVSSDAVARRTGKSWAEWFALLDAAGAAELDHKGIVAVLAQRHGVGPWWQQMVTVAYEQARGIREKQETDDGFQVGVRATLELPLAKLYRLWAEPSERNKWLADDRFTIHKATASKAIRARWGRGSSRIDVDFFDKGAGMSEVTVQHNHIENPEAAEQMKAYWAKKLIALEAFTTR